MLALRTVEFYKHDMCVASVGVETYSFLQNFTIMVHWSKPFWRDKYRSVYSTS